LNGGAGDDILAGGPANDVLIGGVGKDQLRGLGGEDLLIGGTTVYDGNTSQLSSLLAAWLSSAPYASRVAQIESELFPTRLKSNDSVFDDGVADELFGGDGQDWFFLTGFMGVYDPNLAEHDAGATAGAVNDGHSHPGAIVLDHPPALEGFAFIDTLDKLSDRQPSEAIHTLIPHGDDPVRQREHLALTQLIRYSQVTHYAVSSGAWSDPNTWHDGVVPGNGARVLVPIGVDVTVDRIISARVATVRVDGTLSFATAANTELRVDTIVVTATGRFEMGTEAAPIPANISARLVFTDNGPIDRVADPFGIGRGLISHGSVSMYGAAVTSYVAVNGSALAGTRVLTLKSVPAGWKVGDDLVVASSTAGTEENEVRRIVAVAGTQVTLGQPLSYNHVPMSAAFEIHVANTTRNVSISSESSVTDRRGHVMFMHNDDVHVAYAGFYQLGRTDKSVRVNDSVVDENWRLVAGTGTNQRARYAVHFHRTGIADDGNPATVTGSAVVDSPGWGYVNHEGNVDVRDNVAYDVHGAAFTTEDGNEIGSFINNIAIGTTGSGDGTEARQDVQDFGHQGDGFWLQGPGVTVIGNVSAGNDGGAFVLFARGLLENGVRETFLAANLTDPSIANGAAEVSIESVPMRRFSNNVGYASAIGLSVWYHLHSALNGQQGVFADSTFWNNSNGVELPYTKHTTLRNLIVVRTPDGVPGVSTGVGVNSNLVTRDVVYENLTVSGHYRGITFPRRGSATVVGGDYSNHVDFLVVTGVEADRLVLLTGQIQMGWLIMDPYFTIPSGGVAHAFLQDRVILDFGPFQNQRAYYSVQAPSAIPFPTAFTGVPAAYVGLTSQQLWDRFGIAVGGTLAPAGAISVPQVAGLVGPNT